MTKIMQMKQSNGEPFYPKTHVNAVVGLTETTEMKQGLLSVEDKKKLNQILTTEGQVYDLSLILQRIEELEQKVAVLEGGSGS